MANAPDQRESPDARLPDRLRADLRRAYARDGQTTDALDRGVLDAAAAELRRPFAFPRWAVRSAVAGAAVVVLSVGMWAVQLGGRSRVPAPPDTARFANAPEAELIVPELSVADAQDTTDLNRDGRVDILDVLVLARAVDAERVGRARAPAGLAPVAGAAFDLTGDGRADSADIHALALRVVALRRAEG